MRGKKGNLQLLTTGVTVLVMGAFVFIMGLIILDNLYISNTVTAGTITNEHLTSVDDAGEYTTSRTACGFHGLAITTATNKSEGDAIASGNYSVNSRTGLITFVGGDGNYNGTDWTINATYTYGGDEVCEATNETITGMGKLADYYDLIVLAIVIALIISLLLVVFSMRRVK